VVTKAGLTVQYLMVYNIETTKLPLRAFGQTQFITTCIFWKSCWKKCKPFVLLQSIRGNILC